MAPGQIKDNPPMTETQLANLVRMDDPDAVLDEVIATVRHFMPQADLVAIRAAFSETVALYRGEWEATKGCNTAYHDLKHVTDCFLAMARLMHGASQTGLRLSRRQLHQGIVAALLHDVGYLQSSDDSIGTGAKYTTSHVRRSMDFLQRHFAAFGLGASDIQACLTMIHATDLSCDLKKIPFQNAAVERIGQMLAAADILAQMADRTYLEKLLFLFYELDEARIDDYCDELDLLQQSRTFYARMEERFRTQLADSDRFMIHHFRTRWHIDEDLYQRAIRNQRNYLHQILARAAEDPRERLRRGKIVATLRARLN